MSSKHEKTKGGKPKAGMSAMACAEAAMVETWGDVLENPERFVIFRVVEVIGVPKAGAQDFLIRAVRTTGRADEVDLIVPEVFLKKRGKKAELLMPEMGVLDALLVVRPRHVTRERMSHVSNGGFGGAYMKVKVADVDMIVAGPMLVDSARLPTGVAVRELAPTVVAARAGGGGH